MTAQREGSDAATAGSKVRTVLLVDSEELFAEPLTYLLQQVAFAVLVADSGRAALAAFESADPDIVLLDLDLPDIDGLDLCRQLHADRGVPIIVVTARDGEADKVLAFESGADDYVTTPFSGRELIARVSAVLRRYDTAGGDPTAPVVTVGPVQIDVDRHRVTVRGVEVVLRLKDFTVLAYLMRHRGHLVSRSRLIEQIWGEHFTGDPKRVDAIIQRLRAAVELDPGRPDYLLTVRGLGYRIQG